MEALVGEIARVTGGRHGLPTRSAAAMMASRTVLTGSSSETTDTPKLLQFTTFRSGSLIPWGYWRRDGSAGGGNCPRNRGPARLADAQRRRHDGEQDGIDGIVFGDYGHA